MWGGVGRELEEGKNSLPQETERMLPYPQLCTSAVSLVEEGKVEW